MSSSQQGTTTPQNPTTPDRTVARADAFADILKLAREGASKQRFLANAFRRIADSFRSPYAAIHVRYASEVLQEEWHAGPTDPNFWKDSLQQFLTESLAEPRSRAKLLRAKSGSTKVAFLSTPVFDPSGPAIGGIAIVMTPIEDGELAYHLAALEALTRLTSFAAEYLGAETTRRSLAGDGSTTSAAALSRASSCSSPAELAFALTNDLCNRIGCEQVALGTVRRNRVRVLSISGLDTVQHQSPGVVKLRAAMEECHDVGKPIVVQSDESWAGDHADTTFRLHKQWHAATAGDAVASIPLQVEGRTRAVLSLRRNPHQPFEPQQIQELRTRIEPFAAALQVLEKAQRGVVRHAADCLGEGLMALQTPGRWGAKLMTAAAVLAAATFFFGSADYDLTVPCVVTPAQVRHVAAPFDAVLESTFVIEGARVSEGDVMARLDTRDLRQQERELVAEMTVLERTMDRARADDEPVEVQLALANQQLVQAKLDIVQRRIERCSILAPMDGVIVSGDLRKQIGGVVTRGDEMFAIAPLDHWTIELEVPESGSADLAPELAGFFASNARPEETRAFVISRVLADVQIRDGRNVYVAEADVEARDGWLRPGMEGVAKVHMGPRRIYWIALHRALDWLRLNFWL